MDTIEGMRAFIAVAAELSFTLGANRLGISTKVISRQVQQLESRLGAQLLNRTTRSVTLTDTGRAYYDRCVPLLDQLDELEGLVQLRQSELAGPIRVTASTAFGSSELIAAIQPFQLAHPKVIIDLHLSDKHIALTEEGFDLAVRFGQLDDSSLMARRLMDMRIVLVASPNYLQQYGEPSNPEALSDHNCLVLQLGTDTGHWNFKNNGENKSVHVDGSFRANSPRAIAHMAAGGLGIGRCPYYVAESLVQSGSLKILLEANEAAELSVYAVYPSSRHLTARVRALIDHLAEFYFR